MNEKMRDLLELAGFGDIEDIVATIMQVVASSANGAEGRVTGDDAGERDGLFGRGLYGR